MSAYGDDNENVGTNPSTQTHIGTLVEARLSRRNVLLGGMATAVGFMSSSVLTAAPAAAAGQGPEAKGPRAGAALLGYTAIPLGYGDDVAVPPGYTAQPFLPWGTPILGAFPAFRPGANTAAQQEQQVGMHHDGMHFFATGAAPAVCWSSTTSTPTSAFCTPAAKPTPARPAQPSPPTRSARARPRTA